MQTNLLSTSVDQRYLFVLESELVAAKISSLFWVGRDDFGATSSRKFIYNAMIKVLDMDKLQKFAVLTSQ